MADTRALPTQIEDYELSKPINQQDDIVRYPECLRGLSEHEITKLGRRTTMKMDFIVMPALVIMYVLNYLAAKLAGINEDLGLSTTRYNTVVSKIRYPGLYICCAVAVWGIISACTAVVNSFGGLLACLTFLYLRRQNIKLEQGKPMGRNGPTSRQQAAGYRYML